MSSATEASFGRMRAFFFPIYRHEWAKFLPMMVMLSLICFNYTVLRTAKDAVVVTAAGAEVIPFIKVWVMLPTAVLLAYLFSKLTNLYSQERVFYIMISSFLLCYALFAFVLYPYRDSLHAHGLADMLMQWLPQGCAGLINMLRYWSFTGFYVMSELWSSMIMSTLFWGFTNEITRLHEARRFYGVLSIANNGAGILASQVAIWLSDWVPRNTVSTDGGWETILQLLIGAVIAAGLGAMAIFWWMNRTILRAPEFEALHSARRAFKAKKSKLSIKQSLSYLSNSRYLMCLAAIVVSYNLVINLVEIVWKGKLQVLYPSPVDYNNYTAHLTTSICIVSSVAALFMPQLISLFGWTKTALITPIIMLLTSAGFFGFLFVQDSAVVDSSMLMASPLAIAVFFGAIQNCLSKAAKFSVFDATKEMAFIPLDHDTKLKGKAAIDGVGSRLGKSGGSFIHQGLFIIFGSLSMITPYVAVILFVVIGLWIVATRSLGSQFNVLADEQVQDAPVAAPVQAESKPKAASEQQWQIAREAHAASV
jgi:AAA family ATP:ADP antiporter